MNNITLLGVPFPECNLSSVLQKIEAVHHSHEYFRVATVNPEFLVAANKNTPLRQTLLSADLRVVDGFGLWLALRLKGFKGSRITGAALMENILKKALVNGWQIAMVLSLGGLTSKEELTRVLQKKYPKLNFLIFYEKELLNNVKADIFLIALGIPEQEYLGSSLKRGIVIGIGGAMDFLSGKQIRAPKFIQVIGLEWLWRLLRQPKRWRRILRAIVIFPLLILRQKK